MEATARVDERSADNCLRVYCYQEVVCYGLCVDWKRFFVDVVVGPGFERGYGWEDDYYGYGMKNRNYGGGLTRAEKAVEGE